MARTIAQVEAAWTTHSNIARLQYALAAEKDEGRRKWLAELLADQRALVVED
jgi:hypothetical protein